MSISITPSLYLFDLLDYLIDLILGNNANIIIADAGVPVATSNHRFSWTHLKLP